MMSLKLDSVIKRVRIVWEVRSWVQILNLLNCAASYFKKRWKNDIFLVRNIKLALFLLSTTSLCAFYPFFILMSSSSGGILWKLDVRLTGIWASAVGSDRGRPLFGRGGYRNGNFRGRGNYGEGRSSGGNEFGNRGEFYGRAPFNVSNADTYRRGRSSEQG